MLSAGAARLCKKQALDFFPALTRFPGPYVPQSQRNRAFVSHYLPRLRVRILMAKKYTKKREMPWPVLLTSH